MKNKLLFAFVLLLASAQFSYATIRTVSNNFNTPGQYSDLGTAINACNNGDTIYVHASSTQYSGSFNINKRITILGAGYNGKSYQFSNLNSSIGNVYLGKNGAVSSASGTKLAGLKIAYLSINNDTMKDIVIERCQLNSTIYVGSTGNLNAPTNWTLTNNILTGQVYVGGRNNLIANNFIYSIVSQGVNTFTNNIIMGSYGSTPLGTMVNTIFTNNIIYNYNATSIALTNANQVSNSFSSNITFGFTAGLPGANNTGANNQTNVNPQYNRNFGTWAGFDSIPYYDWSLKVASTGHNAGTDGTDIGVYGGSYAFANLDGVTQLPQVRQMTINNATVPLNGNINVNVIGVKRD